MSQAAEVQLDQFNQSLRASQFYQDWVKAHGVQFGPGKGFSDANRKQLQRDLEAIGVQFPKGSEIDAAGNMNQTEGFGKQLKRWGPIVGGAALMAFGIPGVMPGLIGGGGAAAGAGAGAASAAGGAGAAGAGAAGSTFGFTSLLPTLIGSGGQMVGNVLANRAQGKAADVAAQSAREALQWDKDRYYEQEGRLQPYRDLGGQAYGKVAKMLGLDVPTASPASAAPAAPTNSIDQLASKSPRPVGFGQTPAAQAQGVQMQAPTGEVSYVSPAHVQAAIAKGARLVPQSWRFMERGAA